MSIFSCISVILTELMGKRRKRLQLGRAQFLIRRVGSSGAGTGVIFDPMRIYQIAQVEEIGVGSSDADLTAIGRRKEVVAVGSQALLRRIPPATVIEDGQCRQDCKGDKGEDDGNGDFGRFRF